MNKIWKNNNFINNWVQAMDDDRLWPFNQTGWVLPPMRSKEDPSKFGLAFNGLAINAFVRGFALDMDVFSVDFGKVINSGLNRYLEEIEQEIKKINFSAAGSLNKLYFLQAASIVHKAIISYAGRFSDLATKMASKEKDPQRKKELEEIAATCAWVPANPPRTFKEAIQSFWFLYMMVVTGVAGLQRFDQYMYPFYKKDIEAGRSYRGRGVGAPAVPPGQGDEYKRNDGLSPPR